MVLFSSASVQFVMWILLTLAILRLVSANSSSDDVDYSIVNRVIKQCYADQKNKYPCLANKAAMAMEHAINADISLFDGITLTHNEDYVNNGTTRTSRNSKDGIERLYTAVVKFIDSHTIKIDLMKEEGRGDSGGLDFGDGNKGGGGGGLSGGKKKGGKKDKKYLHYALMILLGVFGISGPLIMKMLAVIAGKALIASKIALIVVGSVALKKIFEKDHSYSNVKVYTHTIKDHDDHDRNINAGAYKFLNTL